MKQILRRFIVVASLFTGILFICFPFICNELYQRESDIQIQVYQEQVKSQTDQRILKIKDAAGAYNAYLAREGPCLEAPVFGQDDMEKDMPSDMCVLDLDGSGRIGYLEIPPISVRMPIYEGTGTEDLKKGAGHLEGSSLPIGGKSTHAVIAGHTGMDYARLFNDLEQMQKGELFFLYVLDEKLVYQVKQIDIVLPQETDLLKIRDDRDLCTLVTCTPYGINTHRLLVTGERINLDGEDGMDQTLAKQNVSAKRKKVQTTLWVIVIVAGIGLFFVPEVQKYTFSYRNYIRLERWKNKNLTDRDDSSHDGEEIDYKQNHQESVLKPDDSIVSEYNQGLIHNGQEQQFGGNGFGKIENLGETWRKDGFGVITIPAIHVELPLFLGTSQWKLSVGAGIMEGTSIPLGDSGCDQNCVIAAHRGYKGIPFFRDIENLKENDLIYITNPWKQLTYQVESTRIVDPDDTESLVIQKGRDMITLLTCHPYGGGGKQRYLVYCVRVKGEIESVDQRNGIQEDNRSDHIQDRYVLEPKDFFSVKAGSISRNRIALERWTKVSGVFLLIFCLWNVVGRRKRR